MGKQITLIIALVFMSLKLGYAQEQPEIKNSEVKGMYLNFKDFQSNTLSCSKGAEQKDTEIKLKQFFISPKISCVKADDETTFYKDSIFAIHLADGENYRFISRIPFHIVDTSFLYIYKYNDIDVEYKHNGPVRSSIETPVTHYYFSYGDHQQVYSLSVANICSYVPINADAKVAINKEFANNETLYSVSENTAHFLINDFLLEQKNKE